MLAARPHLFSDTLVYVARAHSQAMARLIEVVERVTTLPGWKARVLAHAPAIARHAPASAGKKAPSLVLPWSNAQAAASMQALAACPPKGTVPAVPAGQPAPTAIAPLPGG